MIQHLIAFSMIKGLGPVTVKNLVAYLGSPEKISTTHPSKLLKIPNIGTKTLDLLKQLPAALQAAEKEMNFCEKNHIQMLTYTDANYPKNLKFMHDAPLVLFQKGAVSLNAQANFAIVGTRQPSEYGKNCAAQFAAFFAERGINVVSGLAYGIDITAHKTVLQHLGITTAVVGHGLDRIYPPTHYDKAQQMLERGGWISEFVSGTKPDAPNFPARNRIISGISDAIIVVEAAKSGGALITARFGAEQNRLVYAIPGELGKQYAEGCNMLIRDSIAKLVMSPQEVLDDLDIKWETNFLPFHQVENESFMADENMTTQELKVMQALQKGEKLIDSLSHETEIEMSELNGLLVMMEFKGWILQLPGKKFKKQTS